MPAEGAPRVYFDSNIFIYAMETDGDAGILPRRWLMHVEHGRVHAVTSELTMAEVLPHPLAAGDTKAVDAYHRLLRQRPALTVSPVDRIVILKASDLRARSKVSLPDALHVATAIAAGCMNFLTEDERLQVPEHVAKLRLADLPAQP